MRISLLALFGVAFFGCLLLDQARAAVPDLPKDAVLERVVLVARHGIRSPTQPLVELERETGRDWPVWPVAPGQLTDHGRQTLAAMAKGLAGRYAALLPQVPCPSVPVLALRADPSDDRTRQSGAIMAQGLSPHCPIADVSAAVGKPDPLFNAIAAGAVALDRPAVTAAVDHAIAAPLSVEVEQGIARLQDVTGQTWFAGPLSQVWKHGAPHLEGGPQSAATIAEDLLLAYAEGVVPDWAGPDVAGLVRDAMPVHDAVSAMIRRQPLIAQKRSGLLASTIEALMRGQDATLPDGVAIDAATPVVVFAGHDTTLDGLATIFGLDWHFADQPDRTAPDTTLAFERYRVGASAHLVRIVVLHQSLAALRAASAPEVGQVLRSVSGTQSLSACQLR